MLISQRKKFIFLKIGQSASTSVEEYFEKYCMPEGEWKAGDPDLAFRAVSVTDSGVIGARGPHQRLSLWYGGMTADLIKLQVSEDTWTSFLKFMTIRNPYEMAVAKYCIATTHLGFTLGDLSTEIPKFEQWLVDRNYKSSSSMYLIDAVPCYDDVIRYESLAEDMARICGKIGETFDPTALRAFKSKRRPSELNAISLFTDVGKKIVKTECQFELDTFGYEFPTTSFKYIPA